MLTRYQACRALRSATTCMPRRRPSSCMQSVRAFASAGQSPSKNDSAKPSAHGESGSTSSPPPLVAPKAGETPSATASAGARVGKPIQNLRDVMDTLDIMIEEAERKMVKKYRPNMFAEFKQLNDTNGKVLEGAAELLAVDKAVKVPSLKVESLLEEKELVQEQGQDKGVADMEQLVLRSGANAVTLVATSFKNFGLNHLPAWYEPFLHEFGDRKGGVDAQVVTLNVIEDWYMKVVKRSIVRGLREKTPRELHGHTFSYFGRCDAFRTVMDLNNSFVGYVHLVDRKGRIRWMAGGPATPEEVKRLMKVTRELLVQQKQSSQRKR